MATIEQWVAYYRHLLDGNTSLRQSLRELGVSDDEYIYAGLTGVYAATPRLSVSSSSGSFPAEAVRTG